MGCNLFRLPDCCCIHAQQCHHSIQRPDKPLFTECSTIKHTTRVRALALCCAAWGDSQPKRKNQTPDLAMRCHQQTARHCRNLRSAELCFVVRVAGSLDAKLAACRCRMTPWQTVMCSWMGSSPGPAHAEQYAIHCALGFETG